MTKKKKFAVYGTVTGGKYLGTIVAGGFSMIEFWQKCFVEDLLKEFPGLKDGKAEVNGADLVDWITDYLQQWGGGSR